jgi:hypothetical protein
MGDGNGEEKVPEAGVGNGEEKVELSPPDSKTVGAGVAVSWSSWEPSPVSDGLGPVAVKTGDSIAV